jgi:hypothetical protein
MVRFYRNNKEMVASHIPLLVRVFDISEGDVLEIGTGYFSTLILHWLAEMTKRHVYSYENSEYWYNRAKKYESTYHHIIYCKSWDEADFDKKYWGLVFVDHEPGKRREIEMVRLANMADYIIMHDSNIDKNRNWNYDYINSLFKYRYDYTKMIPWTTVFSNTKKLSEIS